MRAARLVHGEADLLPGDGYDIYLKPFRTIEDIHVHAALIGYLVGVARRLEAPLRPCRQLRRCRQSRTGVFRFCTGGQIVDRAGCV